MCDPMTAIGIGLSAAGQVAGFAGQQQATDDYNASAKQNAINASVAATRQYQDEGFRYAADVKAANQEGYDAVMRARQAAGTAKASAGTSGLDLGSVSVQSILSDINNTESRSKSVIDDRRDESAYAYRGRTKSIEAQAQGRINSMPFKEGPSKLGLALGIASSAFGVASKNDKIANKINGYFGG